MLSRATERERTPAWWILTDLKETVAVRRAAQITGIAPQFLVDDLDRAIAYYRDRLGFGLDFTYQSLYAGVRRDGFAIHLKHGTADVSPRRTSRHLV